LGAQSGIGGGGRYDGLMAELGGSDISGIGFGLGIDRILLACEAEGLLNEENSLNSLNSLDLFLISLGEENKDYVVKLLNDLRNGGVSADMAYGDRALKGAMKAADKSGAKFAVVIGDGEISSGKCSLKDMKSGESKEVRLTALAQEFAN
jgi:histidyl-tRNA synthetase